MQSQTSTKTSVSTGMLGVIAIGLAAAIAYVNFTPTRTINNPSALKIKCPPGVGCPIKTPGYDTPGYEYPGYQMPGYSLPGYGGIPGNPFPGYHFPGYSAVPTFGMTGMGLSAGDASTCQNNGWTMWPQKISGTMAKSGDIIKGSGPALYHLGSNSKRYVFGRTDEFESWFPRIPGGTGCPIIYQMSDADLAKIPVGGYVLYRPGSRLMKIVTDPKIYAISKGGILHWVENPSLAAQLYGSAWQKNYLRDLPDAFFVNYTISSSIDNVSDYSVSKEATSVQTINQNLGL